MTTLLEFIEARLAEDEQTARAAIAEVEQGASWLAITDDVWKRAVFDADRIADHIARHDPARVLREVQAKLAALALHSPHHHGACPTCWRVTARSSTREDFPCPTLRLLAAPYADHSDYRSEWSP